MSQEELDHKLKQHRLWIETCGAEGERANLRGADLRGAYLMDADLQRASLMGVNLRGVNLMDADLRGAKFDINIRDCWRFDHTKFTADALPWLILHPKWAEWKDSAQIVEANDGSS